MGAIYLIRHGQASFGSSNYDQLSGVGHAQSRVLGAALKARGVQPTTVISGTMQRHRETAAGSLDALMTPAPNWTELAGVNEFDHENVIEVAEPRYQDKLTMMGDMAASGDPRRAFQQFFKGAVSRWVGGEHAGDYQEPWQVFKQRALNAFNEVGQRTEPKGTTLVYTSGGTISVICAHLLGLSDAQAFTINWTLANTGITKVLAGRDGLHLVSLNEHAHLEGGDKALLTYR
jgi:broad specificity phosphatase PhoE